MVERRAGSRKRRWGARAAWAIAALALAACVPRTHLPLSVPGEGRREALVPVPAAFAPPRARDVPDLSLRYARRVLDYELYRFSYPSSGVNRQPDNLVRGRYFHRSGGGRRGLAIVLPIWGRSKYPTAITTRRLVRRGELDVLVLAGERSMFDWRAVSGATTEKELMAEIRRWESVFAVTVEDVRRAIDWAASRPEVDASRIGLVGFSMGAVLAATVTGLDSRVSRGVFVEGSPRLEDVFLGCPMLPGRVRERLLARFDWTREDLRGRLAPELAPINPITYAARIDPRNVLLFDAARDRFVPRASREELWVAMGRPERITLRYGHGLSFLSFTFLDNYRSVKDIARFLHARPAPPPLAPAIAAGPSGARPGHE